MTDTRGRPNRECVAQGAANVVTGFFGGMGGCAMIGQSMINVNAGALRRLSGIATALFLLSFILFGSSLIEAIPLGALIGVMWRLSPDCLELLDKAKGMVEVNVLEDPRYFVADDKVAQGGRWTPPARAAQLARQSARASFCQGYMCLFVPLREGHLTDIVSSMGGHPWKHSSS